MKLTYPAHVVEMSDAGVNLNNQRWTTYRVNTDHGFRVRSYEVREIELYTTPTPISSRSRI